MRTLLAVTLAATVLTAPAAGDEASHHLFILSGQSNMVGLDPGASFTPAVAKAFGADRVIVVKDAASGQPILRWYKNWKPPRGDSSRRTGDLYDRLMRMVKASVQGRKLDTVTFVWMQGERDAREKWGEVYAASLTGLIAQLRKDLGREDVNVVIGRLSDFDMADAKYSHWTMVRKAQEKVANADRRAAWVDTDDLNGPNDDLHYVKPAGYKVLGERFAAKAIALIRAHSGEAGMLAASAAAVQAESRPAADARASGVSMKVPDDVVIDAIVAKAPKPDRYLDSALKLKLVDYIDCRRDPNDDPHPYAADTHSRITLGQPGRYRETGTHANSWFAYRFRTGRRQAPHVVIVEHPDDAERTACVFLHESWMKGAFNSDFHVEGGYWTGRELPVSETNQAIELWVWPTDRWPAIVVMNHTDSQRAAASRIWVYEVTGGLPPAEVREPNDLPRRHVGAFFEDTRMFRYNFGSYGPTGPKRLVQYVRYAGHNMLSFDVVLYAWSKCSVPAFEGNPGGGDPTEQVLVECDKAGVDFLAVFDPTAQYKVKGLPTGDLTDEKVIDAWVEGIEQFVDRYGKHPSLKGVSFGGPAGCNRFRSPKLTQLQLKLHAMLQKKRPDIALHVFFGNKHLHGTIFNTEGYRPYNAIISKWEAGPAEQSFDDVLAAVVSKYWRDRLHMDVKDFRGKPGLIVHRSFYPNDHRCFEHYPMRTPRYMIYRDYNRSQKVSDDLANGGAEGACIFGSYFEMVVPLWAPRNFWWERTWIAPQVPAGGPHALEAYTEPLYQRDYPVMLHGSWNEPLVGHASRYRAFARAFRTLPAKPFETVHRGDCVAVRRLAAGGATWFYVLNNHASEARVQIALDGQAKVTDLLSGRPVTFRGKTLAVDMPPYSLRTFKAPGAVALGKVSSERGPLSIDHVFHRMETSAGDLVGLMSATPELPGKYKAALDEVAAHIVAGRVEGADRALPDTLAQELKLRLWMTKDRPRMIARRTAREVRVDGKLDEWRDAKPAAVLDQPGNLANNHHFGHQWSGPKDLSATVWAEHDGTNLLLAVRVLDQAVHKQDGLLLKFPLDYRSLGEGAKPGNRTFQIAAPTGEKPVEVRKGGAHLLARRTKDGYIVEAAVPLEAIGAIPGGTTGLHLLLEEIDDPDYPLPKFTWSRIQHMEWPVNPWWTVWRDSQCAGELRLTE
ncbi:MAG TPA: sialate O-acetylesterase [Phycisphaerae bacterium]|nr:sialate O-acetylesterase [Phycisphaerae bacterium]